MAISVGATRQILADAYCTAGDWISVHTGAGAGSTGANEATGGSPAYARKQTVWATGANGVKTGSQVAVDLAAATYTGAGLWTAVTSGTFRDSASMTSTVLSTQGQILVTPTVTIT